MFLLNPVSLSCLLAFPAFLFFHFHMSYFWLPMYFFSCLNIASCTPACLYICMSLVRDLPDFLLYVWFWRVNCSLPTWLEYVPVTWTFFPPSFINFLLAALDFCTREAVGEGKGRGHGRGKRERKVCSSSRISCWLAALHILPSGGPV